ncbi:hypothetical protein EXE30_08140 [Acinetobacter halotolerans]|uniref:Lipoprotein n=1 Tax=Acinetobacter halotolerans TaxID=1752076 RepID=A0A4Q6XBZ6_9GAMM|nr:hypothetical protein [Acinetobacter halotolerans]RZF53086.1 hypothetical protein EXE30_08140 [Acinetobacter halotolerans]
MNSIKNISLTFLLCGLANVLTACGENFSASNVSLGGSGSGHQKPPNPTGGDSIPSHDEKDTIYYVKIPAMNNNECMGMQRNVHFIFTDSKQAIPVGSTQYLPLTSLQVEIKNTTPNYIFERADQCQPFKIQKNDMVFARSPYPHCSLEQQSVQVFQPYETKIYTLNLDFINAAHQWDVNYLVSYGSELPSTRSQWEKCPPLPLSFTIQKRKIPTALEDELQQPTTEQNLEATLP